MPRRSRCVLPGFPCHVTQRGVDRRETFSADDDRCTYLRLLRQNLEEADVRLLAWCLMPNHVHLIAVPVRDESLSILLRRVHGRYSQYYNARWGRSGHLWQNRFFACVLGADHLWAALAYVERNPVRAGLVRRAADYRWSSTAAHVSGTDEEQLLDMEWWRAAGPANWRQILNKAVGDAADSEAVRALRESTHSGKPFADQTLVDEMAHRFGRHWTPGRPSKKTSPTRQAKDQFTLF